MRVSRLLLEEKIVYACNHMKLLFDQNISFRLIKKIKPIFPNADQVRHLGLENASDQQIWLYAKTHGYTIVTFDADFLDIAQIKGIPPKIIWLRMGNTTTDAIVDALLYQQHTIAAFIQQPEHQDKTCLEIN